VTRLVVNQPVVILLICATAVCCGRERQGSAASGSAPAEPVAAGMHPGSPVQAELLSDVAIVQPGEVFKLGVLLTMEPGWYVHWINPGGSGEAISIDFKLPSRFEVGPLRWPIPLQFEQPDGTVGYGYQNEVLIHAEVRASNRDVDDGEIWPLSADVRWLACEHECVPGRSTLQVSLPGSISGTRLVDLINAPRVEKWLPRVPVASGSPLAPFTATVSGLRSLDFVVSLTWQSMPSNVQWFPAPATAAATPVSSLHTSGRRTQIELSAPTSDTHSGLRVIDGVVAYTDASGERRAAELSVAVNGLSEL